MNSMLEDVLAREGSAPAFEDSRVDIELEEMLSKMRTNIKIIGLGGGGCNTIARVYNEGIVGAELFACNTDAQHLLHITSPKKVLLGRRITKGLGAGALARPACSAMAIRKIPPLARHSATASARTGRR